jgi:hypothetical protein
MTAEKLKQRLQQSASDLRLIVTTLSSISSPSIHTDCIDEIRKFETIANQLSSICDLLNPRENAHKLLQQLPLITDPSTDIVDYHGIKIPFSNARILGFQGYISMTWSICDSITTAIAPLICTESTCKDRSNPPQLLTHFIKESKYSSYYTAYFLKLNYGWAIGVSYVIRNHFFHDGASLQNGKDFFVGISLADEFDISNEGWDFLEKEMAEKHNKLKNDHHRLVSSWPWHRNNLLNLLRLCNEEIDEALTCLVGWAVGMATLQARYLLERDFSAISPPAVSS